MLFRSLTIRASRPEQVQRGWGDASLRFSSVVGFVPTELPGAVAVDGADTVLSATDFIESDDAEGFPGSWGADLSSKRPVAEADIAQYDRYEASECEKRDHLCPMFGRCVPDV